MQRVRLSILVLVAVALLAACSGNDVATDEEGAATEGEVVEQGGETVMSIETPPGSSDDYEGARDDVGEPDCRPGDGTWVASGEVTNPTDEPADYRIYVSFLDDESDTVGLLEVPVADAAPGEPTVWRGELELEAEGLTCTLRVERVAAP